MIRANGTSELNEYDCSAECGRNDGGRRPHRACATKEMAAKGPYSPRGEEMAGAIDRTESRELHRGSKRRNAAGAQGRRGRGFQNGPEPQQCINNLLT